MKAKSVYYFRKRVKQGKDFVLKDVKFDPFNIENENGITLGDLFEKADKRLNEVNEQYDKLDRLINKLGGGKNE